MEKGKVRAWYDKLVDIFCMLFKEGPSYVNNDLCTTYASTRRTDAPSWQETCTPKT